MVTPKDLRGLVAEGGPLHPDRNPSQRRSDLEAAVRALGSADDDVVSAAREGLDSEDRNVRAAMLRVLGLYESDAATEGILRGLEDPVRRVREVAIKSAHPLHLASTRVIERLRQMAEDESQTDRIRRNAFFALSSARTRDALPEDSREAMAALMNSARFRLPILVRLCKSLDQTAATRLLLREFVDNGNKDEAVMATRALCGYCLVRVDSWLEHDQRRHIRETFDQAPEIRGSSIGDGAVNYWVPRDVVVELLNSVGRLP